MFLANQFLNMVTNREKSNLIRKLNIYHVKPLTSIHENNFSLQIIFQLNQMQSVCFTYPNAMFFNDSCVLEWLWNDTKSIYSKAVVFYLVILILVAASHDEGQISSNMEIFSFPSNFCSCPIFLEYNRM